MAIKVRAFQSDEEIPRLDLSGIRAQAVDPALAVTREEDSTRCDQYLLH